MTEPLHPEVAILNAVLELPVAERSNFLDRACLGNPALREQVDELLRAHDAAEAFLEVPATGVNADRTVVSPGRELLPGQRIDRYKLLEKIGEGGCGIIYVAEQETPVRRKVALKVIKAGMDTKQVVARF